MSSTKSMLGLFTFLTILLIGFAGCGLLDNGYVKYEDVTDGGCFVNNLERSMRLDRTWLGKKFYPKTYITGASPLFYNMMSNMIRYHGLNTLDEPKKTGCILMRTSRRTQILSGFAFNDTALLDCGARTARYRCIRKFQKNKIVSERLKPAHPPNPFVYPRSFTVSWTNFLDTVVVIFCTSDQHKAWAAFSSSPDIDDDTRTSIQRHAQSLGFRPQSIIIPDADDLSQCPYHKFNDIPYVVQYYDELASNYLLDPYAVMA